MKLSMQKFLAGFAAIMFINAAFAADSRVDVSAIINKAEAESVLGTKVKDATPRNVQGGDGYYSKCNYYSVAPGKTLLLRVYQAAPGYDGRQELEMVTKNTAEVKSVAGLGDKAVVTSGTESGLPARVTMLYVSKGSNLVTIGLSGLPEEAAALEKAKGVAQKILTHL
jgi:hypothetical protein